MTGALIITSISEDCNILILSTDILGAVQISCDHIRTMSGPPHPPPPTCVSGLSNIEI